MADYERLFAESNGATGGGGLSDISRVSPGGRSDRAAIPGARIIASLRQPVERAYSDYLMHLRIGGSSSIPPAT